MVGRAFIIILIMVSCISYAYASKVLDQFKHFAPIPESIELDQAKVELGKKLFFDKRLSANGEISCASCHDVKTGVMPGVAHSMPGVDGKIVKRNIPTILNSRFNSIMFWDGRTLSLEDQIDGPITHKSEMANSWPHIERTLNSISEYKTLFDQIYNTPPTRLHIKDAIATYERSLITPNAPFDRYIKGDKEALSELQIKGYQYFEDFGCASCHQGTNIGGNMMQRFGIFGNYYDDIGRTENIDYGLYELTGEEEDKLVFRVPSLRNVELTAPYLHDGSAKTLEEAVDIMAKYQLNYTLKTEERTAIIAFLKSLTGVNNNKGPADE